MLVAEVVVGELARRLGLRTPRLVALDLDAEIARYEADEEVQDLLTASVGLNLGVDFLPGAFGYDGEPGGAGAGRRPPGCSGWTPSPPTSTGPGATPTCCVWHGDLWVIDHGASLYFHHAWSGGVERPRRGSRRSPGTPPTTCFAPTSTGVAAADGRDPGRARAARRAGRGRSPRSPTSGSSRCPGAETPAALRAAYVAFLTARLATRAVAAAGQWRA